MKKYFYINAYSSGACFCLIFLFFVLGSTSPPFSFSRDSPRWAPCANFPLVFNGPHTGRASNFIFRMDLLPLSILCCINYIIVSHWLMKYQWIPIHFQSLRCNMLLLWQALRKERWRTGLQSDKSRLGDFNIRSTEVLWDKIKISKKWKKSWEISSSYTCVPKIMIRWCMVSEIWYVTDIQTYGQKK